MAHEWEPQVAPRQARPPATGFPVGLTVATAIAFAILIGLGVWQLQRLKWKEGVLAHLSALQAAPARPLEAVLRRGGDLNFTRVSFDCPDLLSRPRARVYGIQNGQIVYRLMVACPLPGNAPASILVDIGYEDCAWEKPYPIGQAGPLIGILRKPDPKSFVTQPSRPAERLWYWRDLSGMARALGAPSPSPMFVALEQGPEPTGCHLTRAPIPINVPNNHLQYALTWFGLAGALAGVYGAAVFKRLRG
jgi:surfeit locus 1 family protein